MRTTDEVRKTMVTLYSEKLGLDPEYLGRGRSKDIFVNQGSFRMKKYVILMATAGLLGACATTPPTSAEIESCRKMEGEMGLGATHDHNEMKGKGFNPMNISHKRCQQILKGTN